MKSLFPAFIFCFTLFLSHLGSAQNPTGYTADTTKPTKILTSDDSIKLAVSSSIRDALMQMFNADPVESKIDTLAECTDCDFTVLKSVIASEDTTGLFDWNHNNIPLAMLELKKILQPFREWLIKKTLEEEKDNQDMVGSQTNAVHKEGFYEQLEKYFTDISRAPDFQIWRTLKYFNVSDQTLNIIGKNMQRNGVPRIGVSIVNSLFTVKDNTAASYSYTKLVLIKIFSTTEDIWSAVIHELIHVITLPSFCEKNIWSFNNDLSDQILCDGLATYLETFCTHTDWTTDWSGSFYHKILVPTMFLLLKNNFSLDTLINPYINLPKDKNYIELRNAIENSRFSLIGMGRIVFLEWLARVAKKYDRVDAVNRYLWKNRLYYGEDNLKNLGFITKSLTDQIDRTTQEWLKQMEERYK